MNDTVLVGRQRRRKNDGRVRLENHRTAAE
jgi:hypothetical protein